LELELGGKHEVCPVGIADIVTKTQLIEIKNWKNWKQAIGQILVYAKYFPGRELRCHLFGMIPEGQMTTILKHFADFNIIVTIEEFKKTKKRKHDTNTIEEQKTLVDVSKWEKHLLARPNLPFGNVTLCSVKF
jgi:hypothetical protein